jgi:hypothetical protein
MGSETSMSCRQAFEDDRVGRYVAAELSDAERDAFEIHVLECSPCREALEAHLDLVDALRARPPMAVMAAPRRMGAIAASRARWSGLAAAAGIVFATLGWFGGRHSADLRFETERDALQGSARGLEEQLARTRSEQDRLRGELDRAREAPVTAGIATPPPARISSFALSPGVERGGEGVEAPLSVADAVSEVRFELDLATVRSYPLFRAELRGPQGAVVWSEARLRAQGQEGERFVVVRVTAAVLRGGHHELLLRGTTEDGKVEEAAVYAFSLRRR